MDPKYIIYANIILFILFILITIYFINYVYNLDYVNKYATYMENECDGAVIEQYTMRYITYTEINNDSIKLKQNVIISSSIILFCAIVVIHVSIFLLKEFMPRETYVILFTLNFVAYMYLAGNILYIAGELENRNNSYNQLTDYNKIITDAEIYLGDSIFKNKINNDLQLNDYTPVHSYLKILLKRKSLYENLPSINDAIVDFNESIRKNDFKNLMKYIDYKNDRNALILAYIYTRDNNLFLLDQIKTQDDLNNIRNNNFKRYVNQFIVKLATDPYLKLESRDMNYKLEIFNNLIQNEEYDYLFSKLYESFSDDSESLNLNQINYSNLQTFYTLANYNYGNILYNSDVDTYYTGNNQYLLVNSKFEIHVLNMKFYLIFLLAFIGFVIFRILLLNNSVSVQFIIMIFLSIFIILLFIISISRAF